MGSAIVVHWIVFEKQGGGWKASLLPTPPRISSPTAVLLLVFFSQPFVPMKDDAITASFIRRVTLMPLAEMVQASNKLWGVKEAFEGADEISILWTTPNPRSAVP